MPDLKIKAINENLPVIMSFVDEYLEQFDCSMKVQMQIDLAVEEIYTNIANYAYAPDTGDVEIYIKIMDDKKTVKVSFADSGVAYNPLEKEDPDVSLSAKDRAIGGLGIFLVKKNMDDVQYEYKDFKNILTITKSLF